MIEEEIWKCIAEFQGHYEVSNLGRVRSLDRSTNSKNGSLKICKGRILQPQHKRGYLKVSLSVYPLYKKPSIHRLVAIAFIANPKKLSSINHKDGNKLNNKVSNLEWCTIAENNLHAYRILGKKNPMLGIKGILNPNSKPVICLNDQSVYNNIQEAAEFYKIFATSISKICKGKGNHVAGLKFKYA